MNLPVLYSGTKNASSWAMRAWLALTEAEFKFREVIVDIRKPQRFANLADLAGLSPSATVPLLMVNNRAIFDSLAIIEFANDACSGRLLPVDRLARAEARSIIAWQHAGLSEICARISFESAFYPFKRSLSADEQRQALRLFTWLERCLEENQAPFLFGDFSLVECMLAPTIIRLASHRVDLSRLPAASAWVQAVLGRPSVAQWLADADPLPPIWFDDYLEPGPAPHLRPAEQ